MSDRPDWRDRAAYNRHVNADRRARWRAERRCLACGDPADSKTKCSGCLAADRVRHKSRAKRTATVAASVEAVKKSDGERQSSQSAPTESARHGGQTPHRK